VTDRADLLALRTRLDRLEAMLSRIELRPLPVRNRPQVVQIIGGQTSNGVPVIQYAIDPFTPDKVYDPAVDTTYISGLGNGYLMNSSGAQGLKVLIRHNFLGQNGPLLQGWVYQVSGQVSLSFGTSTMIAYTVTWSAQ
jgi:hypothetical protein